MIEATGNLWTYPAVVRVITTNGSVRNNLHAVMGRGCAAEAKYRYPGLPLRLGLQIRREGNRVFYFPGLQIISFPVKHQWMEMADLELIRASTLQLLELIQTFGSKYQIVMPRPGCGNGGLQWEQVRPLLVDLPDTVTVITW